ncbi:MAG TPA: hypothetical protein VK284_00350 [Streptosporangiaceae bacterium]|nr:hypothetical protein [Streptosporangiaceae bacterium]HLN68281.1 hypothetical protein [Streptosporangiaceae bacterium]
MHKVQAKTLDEYFNADPVRKSDLEALDALIRGTAPELRRWFYAGASDGKPGMRMSLIGYGAFQYEMKSGERVEWPIVSVALQKNYMTLYTSVFKDDAPIVDQYIGRLGELKAGINNFSFVRFDQLDRDAVAALVKDIGDTIQLDPIGSLRYSSYRIVSASARPSTA